MVDGQFGELNQNTSAGERTMLILWKILPKSMRKQFIALFFLMAASSLIDALIIASVIPFLQFLREGTIDVPKFTILSRFDSNEFIIGHLIVFMVITGTLLKTLQTKKIASFVFEAEAILGGSILKKYMDKDYSWFLRKNLSDLAKDVLSEAGLLVTSGIQSALVFLSQFLLMTLVILILIFTEPYVTALCLIIISTYYIALTVFTTKAMARYGTKRIHHNTERFQKVNEILGAIKEFKIFGKSDTLWSEYSTSAKQFGYYQAKAQFLANFPRYILEGILLVAILITVLTVHNTEAEADVLDTIILLTIAAYRLIPASQQIFSAYAQITYIKQSLEKLDSLKSIRSKNVINNKKDKVLGKINFMNVGFRYEKNSYYTLENMNLTLEVGKVYGVVGSTGSGKTTFIDILLGLLPKTQGDVCYIDKKNNKLNGDNVTKSYVSQDFFMFDEDIYYNISLEKHRSHKNNSKVEQAAKVACLHGDICKLRNKYKTKIGNSGKLLSGGQKQRVAIARAIYHDADLIVLDEATSALDFKTEQSFIANLAEIKTEKIIVFVTHRPAVLNICDEILTVANKNILKQSREGSLGGD